MSILSTENERLYTSCALWLAWFLFVAAQFRNSAEAITCRYVLESGAEADGPYAVSFTPDGNRAVVMEGRHEKTIEGNVVTEFETNVWLTVWDLETGQPKRTLRPDAELSRSVRFGPGNPGSLSINADGTLVAAIVPPHQMQVWELSTGRLIWNKPTGINMFHDLGAASVSFSPTDANQIAFTGTAEEQEGQTGGPIDATTFWAGFLRRPEIGANSHLGSEIYNAAHIGIDQLMFATNGYVVTTATTVHYFDSADAQYEYYLAIWEPLGFPELLWTSLLAHRDLKFDATFGQAGMVAHGSKPLVALMGGRSIYLLNLNSGDLARKIDTKMVSGIDKNEVFDRRLALSPSGRYIATASFLQPKSDDPSDDSISWNGWDYAQHRIRIWDLKQQKEVERLFPDKDNYIFMAASRDGRYFAVADGGDVLIFDTPDYWRGDE